MPDLNHQNLNCVQSDKNLAPNTIASAATIAPIHRFTHVTGTVAIVNITPPVTGYHELILNFITGGVATSVAGNIKTAVTPVADRPMLFCYDPVAKKYYALTIA